jgi:hypothetical protein
MNSESCSGCLVLLLVLGSGLYHLLAKFRLAKVSEWAGMSSKASFPLERCTGVLLCCFLTVVHEMYSIMAIFFVGMK